MNIQEISKDEYEVFKQTHTLWGQVNKFLVKDKCVKKDIQKNKRPKAGKKVKSTKCADEHDDQVTSNILKHVKHTPQHQIDTLCLLIKELREPNISLFDRIVARLGEDVCLQTLEETRLQISQCGDLRTADGIQRTQGGSFLYLLKKRISKEDIDFIWEEQKKAQAKIKRDIRQKLKKNSKTST